MVNILKRRNLLVPEPDNEKKIVIACQNGDKNAFRYLYDRYHRPLYLFIYRFLNHRQDAEDALQMTFLNVYRYIGNYRFKARFSSWIFKIALNVCRDTGEKRMRNRNRQIEDTDESVHQPPDISYSIQEAISRLPEKMKLCFILFTLEGFSLVEIGRILGIREGSVKAHLFKARVKLKEELKDLFIGDYHVV